MEKHLFGVGKKGVEQFFWQDKSNFFSIFFVFFCGGGTRFADGAGTIFGPSNGAHSWTSPYLVLQTGPISRYFLGRGPFFGPGTIFRPFKRGPIFGPGRCQKLAPGRENLFEKNAFGIRDLLGSARYWKSDFCRHPPPPAAQAAAARRLHI